MRVSCGWNEINGKGIKIKLNIYSWKTFIKEPQIHFLIFPSKLAINLSFKLDRVHHQCFTLLAHFLNISLWVHHPQVQGSQDFMLSICIFRRVCGFLQLLLQFLTHLPGKFQFYARLNWNSFPKPQAQAQAQTQAPELKARQQFCNRKYAARMLGVGWKIVGKLGGEKEMVK